MIGVSFMLRCHGNEYDDLLILFRFSSSETFFLQCAKINKKTMSDQLVIFPFKCWLDVIWASEKQNQRSGMYAQHMKKL